MTSHRVEARRFPILLPLALVLGLAAQARGEGVSERAKVASSPKRLRGATGIKLIPGGLLAMGGSKLRYMPDGAKDWRTIHQVKGDNLYRVGADERGRLLAVWEQEPIFHLFDLRGGAHRTFAKPPVPPGYKPGDHFSVEDVYFTDGGRAAIVFLGGSVWAYDTGSRDVQAAYRMQLEGEARPELLFSEEGHPLHRSVRGMAMVKPKHWKHGCFFSGCPVDTLVAFEFTQDRVVRKTIFEDQVQRVDSAQNVRGSEGERLAVQIGSWDGKQRHRRLLRYTVGHEPTVHELSERRMADFDDSLLGRNNDYLEAIQGDDRSVTVTRVDMAGKESSARIPRWRDSRGRPCKEWLVSFGERVGGGVWLHWGNSLIVGDLAAPRRHDVGQHLGRGTEWAGAYRYEDHPERLWMGVEVGGGRDYVEIDLAEIDRLARPWEPAEAEPEVRAPTAPAVASRLFGSRREKALGKGVASIGENDVYYRENPNEDWRLLYAVPGRSIDRIQVDEQRGRVLAQWSAERIVHLFEPALGVHRTYPWPSSDLPGLNSHLRTLFFSAEDGYALVYMSGEVRGGGPRVNEGYRVPLDGKEAPKRLFRTYGNAVDLSARGATFVLPTKESAYHCDTTYCMVDSISVVTVEGAAATERVVYRRDSYTDFARRVPGTSQDEVGIVVRYSLPREQWETKGRNERALLRFRYGAPGVAKTVLPPWTTDAVKRMHLTEAGDYLELVAAEKDELIVEILGRRGARTTWRLPPPRHTGGLDDMPDRDVHGFGERIGGGYWLHWGDHVVLLRDKQPARAFNIAKHLQPHEEWAAADRYSASPEALSVGIDYNAGRRFVDLGFAAIEKGAAEWR